MTKENSVDTEIMKKPKKFCCDRVDKLKTKMLFVIVSRGKSVKRTGCKIFGVETQDIPVATRKIQLHQNSIATKSKKKPREQVTIENYML